MLLFGLFQLKLFCTFEFYCYLDKKYLHQSRVITRPCILFSAFWAAMYFNHSLFFLWILFFSNFLLSSINFSKQIYSSYLITFITVHMYFISQIGQPDSRLYRKLFISNKSFSLSVKSSKFISPNYPLLLLFALFIFYIYF